VLYLLGLLTAAARRRGGPEPSGPRTTHFTILVPAHDEEAGVADTVRSLLATDYPANLRRVVVIADNCTDATADRAREAGAEVVERRDPVARGKGQALAWALAQVRPPDAVMVVDADCLASPNLLAACDARLAAGADAVQADYAVANPEASRSSALRFAGYAIMNSVRSAGKDGLGLSAGLLGSGMAFSAETLRRVPWTAGGVAEDAEQHAALVAAGLRVHFAPEAAVRSPMPLTLQAGAAQQMRWETGRAESARRWTGPLLSKGVRDRDADALHQALEPFVPPQSLLLGGNVLLAVAALAARARGAAAVALAAVAGQAAFVLGGLVVVRAPAAVFRALAMAPLLVVWKAWVYVRVLGGRGASTWQRTERDA
jgi:cellulose synthase/poly-beta-1,6-N-acetylglucosamine synthase-like glycosyltransferase